MTGTEKFTDISGLFASTAEMVGACRGTVYGYLRVSTAAQSHERQAEAMKELGVKEENMFFDKQSGKDFERPAYRKMTEKLQEGDLLVIKSLDRLGRNTTEAKEQWWILTKEKKVSIVVIDTPILNAGKELGPLGQAVSDIIFTIFSLISDFDRHSIWQRMHEGLMVAMRERGVKPGRKALSIPENFSSVREEIKEGKISQRAAAKKLGVDRKTLKKWIEQESETEKKEVRPIEPDLDERTDSRKNDTGEVSVKKNAKTGKRGQAHKHTNAPPKKAMKTSQGKAEKEIVKIDQTAGPKIGREIFEIGKTEKTMKIKRRWNNHNK